MFWGTCQRSPTPDNYSQKHTLLSDDFQRLRKNGVCCHANSESCERPVLMQAPTPPSLFKSHENGTRFCAVFRGCRSRGRAFSKVALRTKASWNLEQPWVGRRALSAESAHPVKTSRTWQILGNVSSRGNCIILQASCSLGIGVKQPFSVAMVALGLKSRPGALFQAQPQSLLWGATVQGGLDEGGGGEGKIIFSFVQGMCMRHTYNSRVKLSIFQIFDVPSQKQLPSLPQSEDLLPSASRRSVQ